MNKKVSFLLAAVLLALMGLPDARVLAQTVYSSNVIGFVNVDLAPGFNLIANPLNARDNHIYELLNSVPEGTTAFKIAEDDLTGIQLELLEPAFQAMIGKLPSQVEDPIRLIFDGTDITLEWAGDLQAAGEAIGPYVSVPGATSPIVLQIDSSRRFWRARTPIVVPKFTVNLYDFGAWNDSFQTLSPGEGAIIYNPASTAVKITFIGEIRQGDLTNTIPAGLSIRASMVPQKGRITSDLMLKLPAGDHVFFWDGQGFQRFLSLENNTWLPYEPVLEVGQALLIYAHNPVNWERTFRVQ